jgi:hypothetical protein
VRQPFLPILFADLNIYLGFQTSLALFSMILRSAKVGNEMARMLRSIKGVCVEMQAQNAVAGSCMSLT